MIPKTKGLKTRCVGILLILLLGAVVSVTGQNCSKDNPCATGCCSKDGWCGTGEDHCGAGNCVDTCDFKLQCDENTLCETGCCSNAGYCGLGPDYCGDDVCVSGCDSKAECDPGFGSEWAENSGCPLSVCCSEFGFCGTTKEFCGNNTVTPPTCNKKTATLDRVVGYYEAWASRRSCNAFWPEQIPLGVYTHINFAFAAIDPKTFEVRPDTTDDLDLLMRVTQLKTMDPDLKVLIALGGWTFNDPGPTQSTFSDIARSKENQNKFFDSLTKFLAQHNLDGVDLDWEYPAADDRSGRKEDFENFPKFIANLRDTLDGTDGRNEISITLPSSYWYLQHFDVVNLAKHVDFFNVMSYDLHGKWDFGNKWTGEYLDAHTNLTEIAKSLELLWRNKIDSSKVVMGLAFYARAYTLADPNCNTPGCLFASGANKGSCNREVGILLNNEIDEIVADRGLETTLYEDAAVETLNWDDQWLSYDTAKTLELKTDYARGSCLGGVMVWAVSHDTKDGKYSNALGKVTKRTHQTAPGIFLEKNATIEPNDSYITKTKDHLQCKWTNCGEYCPSGWTMMTRDDQWKRKDGEIMLDDTACTKPHARRLCCPPGETTPSCGWYSFKGGKCYGQCPSGYSEVGSLQTGCRSGYQAACCTNDDKDGNLLNSTRLFETCEWSQSPDQIAAGSCGAGKCSFAGSAWPTDFIESSTGSGAAVCNSGWLRGYDSPKPVWYSDYRKYCCDTSNKNMTWGTCTWRSDYETFGTKGKKCMSSCHKNEIKVAMEGGDECRGKNGGAKTYCCTGVYKATYEVLDPESEETDTYEDSISAWVDNPTCVSATGVDLYARSERSISERRDSTKASAGLVVLHMIAIVLRGSATGASTPTVQRMCKLIDKYIGKKWEHLTCKEITSWANDSDENPTAQLVSAETLAERIECNPDAYNNVIGGTNIDLNCTTYNPDPGDYAAADGSDDVLFKRWVEERDVIHQLVKRSPAEPRTFKCRDKDGKIKTIKYQSQGYPSVGDWSDDSDQVEEAYDLTDWHQCHTTNIQTHNLGNLRGGYATEHLVEVQSMELFFQWAISKGPEQCHDINCDFVANWFNKAKLTNPPSLNGLDASHQAVPMQRVMEQLGSDYNVENFVILQSDINLKKAQLWKYGRPCNDKSWAEYKVAPTTALEIIRDTIAVFNYLRTPKVWNKFKSINDKIREEMQLAQEENGNVDLLDCWDAWMDQQMKGLVDNGSDWVKKALKEMQDYWVTSNFDNPDDPFMAQVCEAVQDEVTLLNDAADEAIQHSFFDLDLGDAMDTSD